MIHSSLEHEVHFVLSLEVVSYGLEVSVLRFGGCPTVQKLFSEVQSCLYNVSGEDALGLLPALHARHHAVRVPNRGGVRLPGVRVRVDEQPASPRLVGDTLQDLVQVPLLLGVQAQFAQQCADDLPVRDVLELQISSFD